MAFSCVRWLIHQKLQMRKRSFLLAAVFRTVEQRTRRQPTFDLQAGGTRQSGRQDAARDDQEFGSVHDILVEIDGKIFAVFVSAHAALENPFVDRRARFLQAAVGVAQEVARPLERQPAHDLAVGELPRLGFFPDAIIRLLPEPQHLVGQASQHLPGVGVQFRAGLLEEVKRLHDVAVVIELKLSDCAVADAHRLRAAVPGQTTEGLLVRWWKVAVDGVEHVQRRLAEIVADLLDFLAPATDEELEKLLRFPRVAEAKQRLAKEHGIA